MLGGGGGAPRRHDALRRGETRGQRIDRWEQTPCGWSPLDGVEPPWWSGAPNSVGDTYVRRSQTGGAEAKERRVGLMGRNPPVEAEPHLN